MYISNYDKLPKTRISGYSGLQGWKEIAGEAISRLMATGKQKNLLILECYHGVIADEIIHQLKDASGSSIDFISVEPAMQHSEQIGQLVEPFVTDDPVFGYLSPLEMSDFFNGEKLAALGKLVRESDRQITCVYGTGASLLSSEQDLLIYADMPRWEIQLRFRDHVVPNLGADNYDDSFAYQYKRAYFVDWRVCDRLKNKLFPTIDYLLDTTDRSNPKMINRSAYMAALERIAHQPFRVVPFFDPGPWGGQWLKEVCDLDRTQQNFAWGFDCVPEENSLLIEFDKIVFETPSINLVFNYPKDLLGAAVEKSFGAEFPIRFDFLDTMEGGNLSLQVHPLKEYIRQEFGMAYTQDESYYFLETGPDPVVYLGLKDNIKPADMLADLQASQDSDQPFDADKYVSRWPIRKHDHVLIPAGTVHCSGANSVVLEISATPYIFTFKLWDWGRMGLDGKPRPISLKHGSNSIQWNRGTTYAKEYLLNQVTRIAEGDGWYEERTGLHEGFFIETRRHWFSKLVAHNTMGVVNVLNLVEGREAIVESPDASFTPFIVHYAETFIVPASVGAYTIRPFGESEGQTCATMKAFINTQNLPLNS